MADEQKSAKADLGPASQLGRQCIGKRPFDGTLRCRAVVRTDTHRQPIGLTCHELPDDDYTAMSLLSAAHMNINIKGAPLWS